MATFSLLRSCASTALFLGVISCAAGPLAGIRAPKPLGASTEAWNRIHLKAAEDLNCRLEELNTKTLVTQQWEGGTKHSLEVTGCGETEIFFLASIGSETYSFFSDMDLRKMLKFSYGD